MLVAISSIIISIATGITLFIQTITLSSCKRLECCLGSCHLDTDVPSTDAPADTPANPARWYDDKYSFDIDHKSL
jgi:hypothetical protein